MTHGGEVTLTPGGGVTLTPAPAVDPVADLDVYASGTGRDEIFRS